MLDTAVRIYRSLIGKKFVWKDGVAFAIGKTMHPDELKFVIFHEGKAVGHAILTFNDKTAHVAEFFIHRDHQGQKFGSNLIEGINAFLDHYNLSGELVN
jgi:GNAT superfamily N-acetyltransferase